MTGDTRAFPATVTKIHAADQIEVEADLGFGVRLRTDVALEPSMPAPDTAEGSAARDAVQRWVHGESIGHEWPFTLVTSKREAPDRFGVWWVGNLWSADGNLGDFMAHWKLQGVR